MQIPERVRNLCIILIVVAVAYIYLNGLVLFPAAEQAATTIVDKSAALALEEDIKAKIRQYVDGVSIEPKENNLDHAIRLDHSVGRMQMSQGQYKDALATYKKVLAISYKQGSLMGVGIGLMILADVAERSGDLDEARYATFLAYKVAVALKNPEEIGVTELAFARRLKDEDPSLSMLWLTRARESLKKSHYQEDYVRVLPGLADALRKLHEEESASVLYEEAWNKAQSLGDAPGQKWAKWEVGISFADDLLRRKQYEKARSVVRLTESYYSPAEKKNDNYIAVLYRRARIYSMLNNQTEANVAYLAAYSQLDLARIKATGEGGRVTLEKNYKALVDDFVDHYLSSNDRAAALTLLESNKTRSLSDIVEDPLFQKPQGAWKAMQLMHVMELNRVLERGGPEKRNTLEETVAGVLAILTRQREDAKKLLSETNLRGTTAVPNFTKEQFDNLRRSLSPDTAILSFFLGHEKSAVFVVTAHGITHVSLAKPAKEYRRAIEELRVALTNPYNDFYREPAQFLYREILAPAVRVLPSNVKVIVYSPDGPLWSIPLASLMNGESFVSDRFAFYEVRSLRSIESFRPIGEAPTGVVACVNPKMSEVELPSEAGTTLVLEKSYATASVMLSGTDCTKDKLMGALNASNGPVVLHIGAPGNLYPENFMDAAVMLSGEGQLLQRGKPWNAKEIAITDMRKVDLLTLSRGEAHISKSKFDWDRESLGILRPLFFAGVQQVLAPRWQVQDDAPEELLQAFHLAYAKNHSAAIALQKAQASVRRNEKHTHPHFWSAFILTGGVRQ
jgi:CHAT domain-containing protein